MPGGKPQPDRDIQPTDAPDFFIGDVPVVGRVFLSPMAGFSDSPYRLLCREHGAGFSFTEFVSAHALSHGCPEALSLFRFHEHERPIIFQIFGNDRARLLAAALRAQELGPDVIDINMGCSVKHVAHKGSGAGLLRDPVATGRLFESLARALEVPLTAKIRIGWDPQNLNYREMARVLESSGAAMISVHGRTKVQGYKGVADWEAIGEVAARVRVPVLGNGDVRSFEDARARQRTYGLAGVLIGRAAMGNPWIFENPARPIGEAERIGVMRKHFESMAAHYGEAEAVVLFRKHAARYIAGGTLLRAHRLALLTAASAPEFADLCGELLGRARSCADEFAA